MVLRRPGAFAQAVTREREKRDWSKGELARRSGVSSSYLVRLESGQIQSPTVDQANLIAAAFEMTPDELVGAASRTVSESRAPYAYGSVALVPLVNISLAAGQTVYGETRESVPVPAELLPGKTLVAARVTGDCMEPEVKPGDSAIVDVANRSPRPGQLVAVLTEDGSMQIKRFERDESGALLLDNKGGSYRPNGAKIQGVIVYVGRAYA